MAVVLLVAVVLLSWVLPRTLTAHPALRPLRSLFPSWRFFDAIDETPLAYVRAVDASGTPSPWEPLIPAPPRGVAHLLYNPRGNMLLAAHAVLDQLIDELEEAGEVTPEEVEQLLSFELVRAFARSRVPPGAQCQLRVAIQAIGEGGHITEQELFTSRVLPT